MALAVCFVVQFSRQKCLFSPVLQHELYQGDTYKQKERLSFLLSFVALSRYGNPV